MKYALVIWILSISTFAQAEQVLWKKGFWGWGQATNTNTATSKALESARPVIAEMRTACDTERGLLTYTTKGGYCTTTTDPMFCPNGCYNCPVYGTATCTYDNTADFKVGVTVEITADSNLMSGTTIVGKVKAGEQYLIAAIQKPWVSLTAVDGIPVRGWVQMSSLKLATR